jgi:hypothetical protein
MFAYNQNGSGAIGESCVTAYMLRWIDSLMRLEGDNPLFPALRSAPTAVSGASRQKQIPSSK